MDDAHTCTVVAYTYTSGPAPSDGRRVILLARDLYAHPIPEPPHGSARAGRDEERPVEQRAEELVLGQCREQVRRRRRRRAAVCGIWLGAGWGRRERRPQLDERREEVDALQHTET